MWLNNFKLCWTASHSNVRDVDIRCLVFVYCIQKANFYLLSFCKCTFIIVYIDDFIPYMNNRAKLLIDTNKIVLLPVKTNLEPHNF